MEWVIKKNDFQEIVEDLLGKRSLIAPKRLPQGDLVYGYVHEAGEISLDTTRIPIMSAKEFFFPREEELFTFRKTGRGDLEIEGEDEPEARVFLGIRSCDMKGVRFLQRFFQEPYNDTTVTKRIEKTLFISLGCADPPEQCFCVCCDGGPFLSGEADVQLTDLEDRFFWETFSEEGNAFFSSYEGLLSPPGDEDRAGKDALVAGVDGRFTRRSYIAMGVKEMTLNSVQDAVWEFLENRCIGCGSCTYVCPTCSCFNVLDRTTAEGGARIRTWDSCNYAGFTRETSGHNPRKHTRDRLKRRFFHKLSYQCQALNGRIGCVGCGRCVVSCPAFVDMSTFVTTLRHVRAG